MKYTLVIIALLLGCRHEEGANVRSCGMSLAHSWAMGGAHGYGTADSARTLDALVDIGIRAITVSPFAFVNHVTDPVIVWSDGMAGAETSTRLRTVIEQAHQRGLEVMLKPQIYPLDGEWCGDIDPTGGWPAWFASYRAFIVEEARLAEATHAEWLVVGHEMSNATRTQTTEWERVITEVRAVYSGRLVYAANWDEASHVKFWPLVDVVGIQMYAPLRNDGEPRDAATLERGARRWLERYEQIAERAGKPLMITEAGFVNRVGVTAQPHVWPEWLVDEWPTFEGDAEQAAGYRALIDTFGRSPRVIRIFWWKWFTDGDGWSDEGALGFTPKGRVSETLLRQVCGKTAG